MKNLSADITYSNGEPLQSGPKTAAQRKSKAVSALLSCALLASAVACLADSADITKYLTSGQLACANEQR